MNHYLGMNPYKVNRLDKLIKEPDYPHDSEAIRVELPFIDTLGYVANSLGTVFAGTCSAGSLYDKFEDCYRNCSAEGGSRKKDTLDMDPNTMQAEPRNISAPKAKIRF